LARRESEQHPETSGPPENLKPVAAEDDSCAPAVDKINAQRKYFG